MICVYDIGNTDFESNGNAVLTPLSGSIKQVAGGNYDLTMEHPIDPDGKWAHLVPGAIVKVPVPAETIENAYAGMDVYVYKTNQQADMRQEPSEPTAIAYTAWSQATANNDGYSAGSKVSYSGKNYMCTYWDSAAAGQKVVIPSNNGWWKQIPNKTAGAAVLLSMKPGTELYWVETYDTDWYKMTTPYGLVGYVKQSSLTYDRHMTPEELQPHVIKEQLFRITEPVINTEQQTVTVTGKHVSYDLGGILVRDVAISQASPAMAIGLIIGSFMMDYDGTIATNMTDTDNGTYTGEIKGKNGIYALLDPDKGIVSSFDAKLTRDNWDIYVMKKPEEELPAFTFRYGKNMRGVTWKKSSAELITRVVPVAKEEGGEDLYLPEVYVDSDRINDYPVVIMERLSVKGQVGKDKGTGDQSTWTESDLLDEMRAKAEERFTVDKADQVRVEITVQFEQLGDTDEYRQLKEMESVLLYDTVKAIDERIGMDTTLEVTELEYDIIRRKVTGVKLSNIEGIEGRSVTGYNVANNSISSEKLMNGVIDNIVQQAVDIMPEYADPSASGGTTPVYDGLDSQSTTDALSANQGYVLNGKIPAVVNSLTSTSTVKALSAKQGKVLNEKIVNITTGTPTKITETVSDQEVDVTTLTANAAIKTKSSVVYVYTGVTTQRAIAAGEAIMGGISSQSGTYAFALAGSNGYAYRAKVSGTQVVTEDAIPSGITLTGFVAALG